MDSAYTWLSNLLPLAATLFAFLYGIKHFFKKGKPLYFQSITMAMGCHCLGSVYHLCQILTSEVVLVGFTPAYLGHMGFFLFFLAASYGQMDRILDDGSKKIKRSRITALIAPVLVICLYIPNFMAENISLATKLTYLLVWVPAAFSLYFNLKHAIIPDLDFGFAKAIKPYNFFAVGLGFAELFCLTVRNYSEGLPLVAVTILFGGFSIAVMVAAKKGVEKWTI